MSNCVDPKWPVLPVSPSLHFEEQGDLRWLWFDKPTGFRVHSPDPRRPGLQELLAQHLKQDVWVVHRLDKETSGLCLMALNAAAVEEFFHLFQDHQIQKTYHFLTDRKVTFKKTSHQSEIARVGGKWQSSSGTSTKNSQTEFQFIKALGNFDLWQARPQTGKAHQIRLHAQDLGLSILGDTEHGGSPHFRLFLHAQACEFAVGERVYRPEVCEPWWIDRPPEMNLIHLWRESVMNRTRLFARDANEVLRWSHFEEPDWLLEAYGPRLLFSYFGEDSERIPAFSELQAFAKEFEKEALFQTQCNREKTKAQRPELLSSTKEPKWEAREEGVTFELRQDQGQSLGLFIDQRGNRRWVREQSQGLQVLNLFCYTGGFSVNAALGGAASVHSIDVSRKYLEWTKQNFLLNGLALENHRFVTMDAQKYLTWAQKKQLRFDLIICDPPTFGRSDEGVFRLERAFGDLLHACWKLSSAKGRILFATNFEAWDYDTWEKRLHQVLASDGLKLRLTRGPGFALDCEPDWVDRKMKSFLLERI